MYMDVLAKMGVGAAHPGGLTLTKGLLDKEAISEHTHILDVGCGTGLTSAYLYEQFQCHITPCDIHPIMIEKANKRFAKISEHLQAVFGNSEALPFEDGSFDFILSESVAAFTNINKTITEFYRVLKPGGKVIAIEMGAKGNIGGSEVKRFKKFYKVNTILTAKEWATILIENHFKHVHISEYQLDMNIPETNQDLLNPDPLDDTMLKTIAEHQELSNLFLNKIIPYIITAIK